MGLCLSPEIGNPLWDIVIFLIYCRQMQDSTLDQAMAISLFFIHWLSYCLMLYELLTVSNNHRNVCQIFCSDWGDSNITVKFAIEEALKAQRGSRGIALLSL
jgi:hypothetical protein